MPASEKIQQIKERLVASVNEGTAEPADVHVLYEWLETDGWDELIRDLDQGMAIDLSWFDKSYFSDSELIAGEDLSLEEVTDKKRLESARRQIAQAIEGGDCNVTLTAHAYPLSDHQGRKAILGCLIAIQGQAGPAPSWQGVFRDRASFIENLHQKHVWLWDEVDSLADTYLLSLWKTEKKKPHR